MHHLWSYKRTRHPQVWNAKEDKRIKGLGRDETAQGKSERRVRKHDCFLKKRHFGSVNKIRVGKEFRLGHQRAKFEV